MSDLWVSGDASLSPSSLHLAVDQFLDEALSAKRQLYLANSSSWICKFFQKGPSACRRGADCPYRHSKNDKPFVCKFWLRGLCLDVDTPISGATGLAQPLAWLADRKDSVLTYDATRDTPAGGVVTAVPSAFLPQGSKSCVELTFLDGRLLVCTPEHRLLTSDGSWVEAQKLVLGSSAVVCGPQWPVDSVGDKEAGWSLRVSADTSFTMASHRSQLLAFARLLGAVTTDGTISTATGGSKNALSGFQYLGHQLDVDAVLADIRTLTGKNASVYPPTEGQDTFHVYLPSPLPRWLSDASGQTETGLGVKKPALLPPVILQDSTPDSFVREFLGGVFGGDGGGGVIYGDAIDSITFTRSAAPGRVDEVKAFMDSIATVLKSRFGIDRAPSINVQKSVKFGSESFRCRLNLSKASTLRFHSLVGFRYCCSKQQRLDVAAAWYRGREVFLRQRARLIELAQAEQKASDCTAAVAIATALRRLGETEWVLDQRSAPSRSMLCEIAAGRKSMKNIMAGKNVGYISASDFVVKVRASAMFPPLSQFQAQSKSAEDAPAASGHTYAVPRSRTSYPTWELPVVGRRDVGFRNVADISVDGTENFIANGLVVHNCKKGVDTCESLHIYDLSKMPFCQFMQDYGACSNPDCLFNHQRPEVAQVDCMWYARGFCKHGPRCKHFHRKREMCPDYLAGFCELGPQCEKGHPKWNMPEDPTANEPQYDSAGKLIPGSDRPREKSLRYLMGMPMAFPGAPVNTRKTMDEIRCLLCHQTGHFAAACPNAASDPNRHQREISSVLCFRCGEHGHYANVCVNPRKEPPPGGWPGAKPQAPRTGYAGTKRPHE